MKRNKIAILIPAYEPDQKLCELLKQLKQEEAGALRIVVVDDGSGEDYEEIFEQASQYATVLHHGKNYGKGRALKTGMRYMNRKWTDQYIVVTMDSDGQHTTKDALKTAESAMDAGRILVLGSRTFSGKVPFKSRAGNLITSRIYKMTTGIKVQDTQTGLRTFPSELIPEMLEIPGERYEYEMNVLLACKDMRINIQEVEIETLYFNQNTGSHFQPLRDSYLIYKEILKFAASSFAGFCVDYIMYVMLLLLTAGMGDSVSLTLSNILARIISSGVNFTINRKYVFKSSRGIAISAAEYFTLAGCILAANTVVLNILTGYTGINRFVAKITVELMFFFISMIVQKRIIFESGRKEQI